MCAEQEVLQLDQHPRQEGDSGDCLGSNIEVNEEHESEEGD